MNLRKQRGITTVEFAIIGGAFLMLLFSVIEIGRALFTWNAMVEATRRAARVAVVCPLNDPSITRVGVFADPAGAGDSLIPGLKPQNLSVTYLDLNGAPTNDFLSVRFVRVEIVGYTHRLLIPFVDRVLTPPSCATTLPRESLGVPRFEAEPVGCAYP
jgi:hypothetical protein